MNQLVDDAKTPKYEFFSVAGSVELFCNRAISTVHHFQKLLTIYIRQCFRTKAISKPLHAFGKLLRRNDAGGTTRYCCVQFIEKFGFEGWNIH